ncbi:ribosome maturation factor RimM [Aestuariimicrobium kwangyangense]|uniref:ribosome maturation factor RimM n=1 Tax=Aestuariimicrobium kwangyangense TaxID=396389 RepID=UPI0003B57972|nr:ribosome maturation factor RimM [Aestuariimicrobium kwangyangense]
MADLIEVTVGAIGRAHGIRGDVTIDVRTDEPERRFAEGSTLTATDREGRRRPLTVEDVRWHSGRLLVTFAEVADRSAAEALRGAELSVQVPADEVPTDEGEYYDRQLVGLLALTTEGDEIGRVTHVVHLPEQDLLAIDADGTERLVPFVLDLVPTVDLTAGTLSVRPIPGLLDDQAEVAGGQS